MSRVYNPVGTNITIVVNRYRHQKNSEFQLINYGFYPTPFGNILLCRSARGICSLSFGRADPKRQLREASAKWPGATFKHKPETATDLVAKIFQPMPPRTSINLLLQGTDFQITIWRTLLETRPGQTVSYSRLAQLAGYPKAQRAVGSALAANPIAYLIPCHRVIKKNGTLGNYRWGSKLKQKILDWESAK